MTTPAPHTVTTPTPTSALGLDYTQLLTHLQAKDWQQADQETYSLLRQLFWSAGYFEEVTRKGLKHPLIRSITGGRGLFPMDIEHLTRFLCQDLLAIDRLWTTHSDGQFGFTVQAQLWFELLEQFMDLDHPVHQWERHGIDSLSPQSERDRCRAFKPNKEDEIFAERLGWYENRHPWPCNNWHYDPDLTTWGDDIPKGFFPKLWVCKASKGYGCSIWVNGGMMVAFGVGYGTYADPASTVNFFEAIEFCQRHASDLAAGVAEYQRCQQALQMDSIS